MGGFWLPPFLQFLASSQAATECRQGWARSRSHATFHARMNTHLRCSAPGTARPRSRRSGTGAAWGPGARTAAAAMAPATSSCACLQPRGASAHSMARISCNHSHGAHAGMRHEERQLQGPGCTLRGGGGTCEASNRTCLRFAFASTFTGELLGSSGSSSRPHPAPPAAQRASSGSGQAPNPAVSELRTSARSSSQKVVDGRPTACSAKGERHTVRASVIPPTDVNSAVQTSR